MTRALFSACLSLVLFATTSNARAQAEETPVEETNEEEDEELPPPEDAFDPSRNHFEFALGFIGGLANYSSVNFAYDEGEGPADLTAPFDEAPYDGSTVLGMRIEARYVASYVRTTLGVDFPFVNFTQSETELSFEREGGTMTTSVQSLSHYTFRFGVGGEYSFGIVTPFIDILGGIHFLNTRLVVDEQSVTYGNTQFGIAGRIGARIALQKSFFIHASGMGELFGPSRVLGELGIGFAL